MSEHAADPTPTPAREKKTVTIEINNKQYDAPSNTLTGAEIKELASIPLDFQLYRLQGKKLIPVGNEDEIKLRKGDRFRAVSGQDVS
jgi:hypothetical protein